VPQVVQPQALGQRVGTAGRVEVGNGLVCGADGRLEATRDELRLTQRATTRRDPDWLVEFTRRLVTDRLCASGHNFAPIRTIYRWQGQVHDKTEGRVALRTRRSLVPQIVDRAKREHPYEVPSVVAVPIIDGGPDYIAWILEQTEQPA
jgi:periplasmic divalent cation tolerance protein